MTFNVILEAKRISCNKQLNPKKCFFFQNINVLDLFKIVYFTDSKTFSGAGAVEMSVGDFVLFSFMNFMNMLFHS